MHTVSFLRKSVWGRAGSATIFHEHYLVVLQPDISGHVPNFEPNAIIVVPCPEHF